VVRVPTGLAKLDMALGDGKSLGLPIRCGVEIYGPPESGKSTLAYYLSGRVRGSGTIALIDLEGAGSSEYLVITLNSAGFDGRLHYVEFREPDGKARTHERVLKIGADMLLEDDVHVLILDSAAMIQPVLEREAEIEEVVWGRRAQVLARWSRRWLAWLNLMEDAPKSVFIINHKLKGMDGPYSVVTPGGDTIKFGCAVRLNVTRSETFDDGSFEAEIRVDKMRFGGKNKHRLGRMIVLPGMGISVDMTTAFDCMEFGFARRKTSVQVLTSKDADPKDDGSWQNVAKLATLLDDAKDGKKERFEAFHERMGWYDAGE